MLSTNSALFKIQELVLQSYGKKIKASKDTEAMTLLVCYVLCSISVVCMSAILCLKNLFSLLFSF